MLSNTNTNTIVSREPSVGATPRVCQCCQIQIQTFGESPVLELCTPRACQCCLLKAIDCDSRLSNYQLISQLSATIMMTIMMALLAMLLMIDNEIVIGVVLNFQPQLILGAV